MTDAPQTAPRKVSKIKRGLREAVDFVSTMSDFHGMIQEELEALGMDPAIADRLAQPMFLRLVTGEFWP